MRQIVFAALIVVSFGSPADAQTTQVWPEISLFTRLNDGMRFYFLATTVKESQESTEGEFGPNFDFYLRPFRNPKRFGGFRLDESKNRYLLLRVGYRYLHSFPSLSPSWKVRGGIVILLRRRDFRQLRSHYEDRDSSLGD